MAYPFLEADTMLKIGVIIGLLALALLATKYLDEKIQKKIFIGLAAIAAGAIVLFMGAELFR
ncbi:hypothetical protein [Photobacterium indicum]|jgi:uncharacterized membrane protein|uniref:Uncharacterized protein n=2 Tax=Photobacterium TaxID=657 RepID=A0A2T3LAK4_9GAMM|nr:hypothetical protein C9J47_07485 [Photobacterium indicum]